MLTARGKRLVAKFEHLIKIDDDSDEAQSLENALQRLLLSLQKDNGFKTFGACKTCVYHQNSPEGRMCLLTTQELSEDEKELICYEHIPGPPLH